MRKIYFISILLLSLLSNAQIINFPDANFKALLLSANEDEYIFASIDGINPVVIDTNGNGEIEVDEADDITILLLRDAGIADLTGIEYFTALKSLDCSYNPFLILDFSILPPVEILGCRENGYTSLNFPVLPSLKTLFCEDNLLTSLDLTNLPNLEVLDCSSNQLLNLDLSVVPNLKDLNFEENQLTTIDLSNSINLQRLNCASNQLTNLNLQSVTGLKYLSCGQNMISALDISLLDNLERAYASSNLLTSVQPNPNLIYLHVADNQLSDLNLQGLSNLESLSCSTNQLTALDLSQLPKLKYLNCYENQLTSLEMTGLGNLETLICSSNLITSLDLNGASNLRQLSCSDNPLASIDFTPVPLLDHLYCFRNLITELDLSNNPAMEMFHCSEQPNMVSMNLKNGHNEGGIYFLDNPVLQYICADDSQITNVQSRIQVYGYTNCHVNSYCSFVPGGNFYTINGNTKFDLDNNGCDNSDIVAPYAKFQITNGTNVGGFISNYSGNYVFNVQAGVHTITPIFENPGFFTVSPALVTADFPTQASPMVQDFCISASGVHPDLEITLLPTSPALPGFDSHYRIVLRNKGNQTKSGTITVSFDDNILDFVSSNPAADGISTNTLTWNFSDVHPFQTKYLSFRLNVNSPTDTPPVNLGDVINLTAAVSAGADDLPADNTFTLNQTVVNSIDPNNKTCVEGNVVGPETVGNYVHYVIQFENTGTANAQNVVVADVIDAAKFDLSSLIPIDSSHEFYTRINANKAEFIFENINLPFDDANNDGYVAFKIKTKPTLVVGDTFSNNASIYFDYNAPIITNTATTLIQLLANPDFDFSQYFTLYPNPVKNILNIKANNSIVIKSISIYNMLGQLLHIATGNIESIDTSGLTSGNYIVKVNSDKGMSTAKFIKE